MPRESMEPAAPQIPEKKKLPEIAFTDTTSHIRETARDTADAKMTDSKNELRGFKGFFKKLWKHNLFKEYYRQKEVAKAEKDLLKGDSSNNLEKQAITQRMLAEGEEAIFREAGEKKEALGETPEEQIIKEDVKKILTDYAMGNINEAVFIEEQNRVFSRLKNVRQDVIDKGLSYASNFLEVAKQIKQNFEHGESLDKLVTETNIILGNAKKSVRTEAQFNTVDRIVDKIQRTKIGRFVNETTVASAVAIAYCVGANLSQRIASSKLFAWGSFGATALLGTGIAAARESRNIETDRRQHAREMAQGRKFNPREAERRKEMEESRIETVSAQSLMAKLENQCYQKDKEGKPELKKLNPEEIQSALASLAEIESRLRLSAGKKIDLIEYSNSKSVEQEFTALLILKNKVKVDIKKLIAEDKGLLPENISSEDFFKSLVETKNRELTRGEKGIEQKNAIFKKMKGKHVWRAARNGLISGLVVGAAAQELHALFVDSKEGLLENVLSPNPANAAETAAHAAPTPQNYTFLEGIRRWFSGELPPRLNLDHLHTTIIGNNHISLPEGADLIQNPDGTVNLMRGSDIISENLKFNPDGTLTEEAKAALTNSGVLTHSETLNAGAKELLATNESLTHKIHRTLWYDNDTPKPIFDKNELKLWWGGSRGTGVDSHGNYVFNIKHMMPDGSYHKSFSIDARDAMASGKLKMLFSLSQETQNQAFEVPIDAHGNAIIDPNSEIGKIFFSTENGHGVFKGKFAEVAQMMGEKNGVDQVRLLATHVGHGIENSSNPFTVMDVPADYKIDAPWFIPLPGRNPLEPTKEKGIPYYLNYNNPVDPDREKIFDSMRSETLKKDPNAKLNPAKEAERYFKTFDKNYEQQFTSLADQMGTMDKNVKLSICIPAAGHQEGKNIYASLKNYTYQKASPESYEICLLVNHPEKDLSGKDIKPDETLQEIERFKEDYPNINVKTAYLVLPNDKATIGMVRKMLNDAVLLRHYNRGNNDSDLIMVSNDADNKGIAPEYVENFINKFESNPEAEGMLGQLDWDPEAYVKYPAIHIGTRLFQYLNVLGRWNTRKMPSSGANFAFKSSIYSAIGGYIPNLEGGEDVAIGQAILAARKKRERIAFGGARVSRLYTSARRAISVLKDGLAPLEQWERGFSPFDDDVRKLELDADNTDIDYDDPKAVEKLKKQLEYIINRTLDVYEQGERMGKQDKYYKKALGLLGIKYEASRNNEVVITNMDEFAKDLKEYKEKGVKMRDRKSGK